MGSKECSHWWSWCPWGLPRECWPWRKEGTAQEDAAAVVSPPSAQERAREKKAPWILLPLKLVFSTCSEFLEASWLKSVGHALALLDRKSWPECRCKPHTGTRLELDRKAWGLCSEMRWFKIKPEGSSSFPDEDPWTIGMDLGTKQKKLKLPLHFEEVRCLTKI